jgi:hypothetical protein
MLTSSIIDVKLTGEYSQYSPDILIILNELWGIVDAYYFLIK